MLQLPWRISPCFKIAAWSISWLLLTQVQAFADFIIYHLPGTRMPVVIEGKVRSRSSSTVSFAYPGFPPIVLDKENVAVVKSPSKSEEYQRLYNSAVRSKSADDYLVAAEFALRGSKIREFYECCSAAYKIAPDNPTLQRLIEVRNKIKQPVEGFEEAEAKLRAVTNRPAMKIAKSLHYILIHDIPAKNSKNPRVERRLELLEQVYEAFMLKFAFLGTVLEPPKYPMMVCLFGEEGDFMRYAVSLDPTLQLSAGFWSPKDNVAVFYDRGTTEEMKKLTWVVEDLRKIQRQSRGTASGKEIAQLTNSLNLILQIAKDESDVEVVSHEATHQLAGNTGLMPRERLGMSWSHEGLASYFETPAGAGWGGVGSVNAKRLSGYRAIASNPRKNKLELLISDYLFDSPDSLNSVVDAYGSAWALTHFLMKTYPTKLVEYYRRCAELGDVEAKDVTRRQTIEIFSSIFGDIGKLEEEFLTHMGQQHSQLERLAQAIKE